MSRSLTLTRSVVVGQAALAAALLAVAPLAGKEEAARVRLVLDPGRGCLAVTATNRCDRALARTPLIEAWDCADGEVVDVDMSAETARTIARVHRPGKDDDGSLEVLGCTETSGISQAATAAPRVYDGPLVGLCEALEVNQPEPRDGGDEIRRRAEGLARDLASDPGVRGLHLVVPGGDLA